MEILPYALVLAIVAGGWFLTRSVLKNRWLRIAILLLSSVVLTNLVLYFAGASLGTGLGDTPDHRTFKLVCGRVDCWINTSGSGDNGSATVLVQVKDGPRYTLESHYDYDLFNDRDPADIYYGFRDLDPFADLVIQTGPEKKYILSGYSGTLK